MPGELHASQVTKMIHERMMRRNYAMVACLLLLILLALLLANYLKTAR